LCFGVFGGIKFLVRVRKVLELLLEALGVLEVLGVHRREFQKD
jgi:hypothetical protein